MHRLQLAGLLMAIVLLAGCATISPAERSARKQREAEEMLVVYGPACERLGYPKDSNEWRDCVLSMANQEEMKAYMRLYGYPQYPYGMPYNGYRRPYFW